MIQQVLSEQTGFRPSTKLQATLTIWWCEEGCMYLLTIKDGLGTRHIGPYASPKHASDDLDRVLETCSERARWQIHALETPDHTLELQAVAS